MIRTKTIRHSRMSWVGGALAASEKARRSKIGSMKMVATSAEARKSEERRAVTLPKLKFMGEK